MMILFGMRCLFDFMEFYFVCVLGLLGSFRFLGINMVIGWRNIHGILIIMFDENYVGLFSNLYLALYLVIS